MSLDFLRDCTLVGPAFPEPFVQFELEAELSKNGLLPKTTGSDARHFEEGWTSYRRKLRELVRGGPIRVRNHIIEPLIERLGYARFESAPEVETREGSEDGGDLLLSPDGNARLRVWSTEFDEDLEAPFKRGAAYRYSRIRIAQRVLLACGERLGILTNGTELRILISDPARPDSQIVIAIDPAWKDKRSFQAPDSYRLLLALASPKGIQAIPDLVEKARLQQARVTKELRRQARQAVEGFLQEVLDHPANQTKIAELKHRPKLAQELWREALIVVYRLLFILKLEATDDPARSFSFASTSLWRNTFSPSVALPRYVRSLLDYRTQTGKLLEQALRALFRMFVEGLDCTELHVRPLGGTLFGEKVTPLLSDLTWGEQAVALMLDQLLWTSPKRGAGRERVHYGSLDVEDLGRVYEALLELEPGITAEPMCRLRRAKLEVVVPMAQGEKYRPVDVSPAADLDVDEESEEAEEADEEEEEPTRGRNTKVEWIEQIQPGRFYLRVGLGRKATGSYYTPHSFVRFLVQETLGPLVAERSPQHDPKPAEILKLKVLDPAMGSGHFLVEACRFLGASLYESARLCDERLAQYEKTAIAAQNKQDKSHAEEMAAEYRRRLEAFVPPDAELLGYLPSRSPEASESGLSQKRAEAICRRLVAVHCLYGVDKNPLAVELAKVSLWIESHSEGLPLTFLDHRLVLGDSITGPFFHRLLTYPGSKKPIEDLYTQGLPEKLTAALGEAIALVQDIESTLGASIGDVEVKQSMRVRLEAALAPFKIVAAACAGGVMLGTEGCNDDAYRWLLSSVAHTGLLPEDLSGQERLTDMIACGLNREDVPTDSSAIIDLLKSEEIVSAFPYDLSFPEVFFRTADVNVSSGFDVVLGNPPWEGVDTSNKEFFAGFDIAILDVQNSKEEKRLIQALLSDSQIRSARSQYERVIDGYKRSAEVLYRWVNLDPEGQSAATLDMYQLFAERAFAALRVNGRVGWVLPSSFHANDGATGIRRLYLENMQLKCCYSFENKRRLFDIHASFKFALVVSIRGNHTNQFSCAYYLHDDAWLFAEDKGDCLLSYTPEFISSTTGERRNFLELRSSFVVPIALSMYRARREFFGDLRDRLHVYPTEELHTSKARHRAFSLQTLAPDVNGDARQAENLAVLNERGIFPVCKGEDFHQYDSFWKSGPDVAATVGSMTGKEVRLLAARYFRLVFRRQASATNARQLLIYRCLDYCTSTALSLKEIRRTGRPPRRIHAWAYAIVLDLTG
jgi:hypothetical protein